MPSKADKGQNWQSDMEQATLDRQQQEVCFKLLAAVLSPNWNRFCGWRSTKTLYSLQLHFDVSLITAGTLDDRRSLGIVIAILGF